uniref:Reverse transcriptase domain-containing protein n=1 Tax=Chromera velia CCMP2878 TaxID=1169474 RepID=A0A0G4HMA1_9ALVE|eukprot:Cvel_29064.t1-p1 / transcript=Cvel_29064.t1 / gene=Cvel_29064 / organism=Chromera_velia_CCMP2878 / gene_product=hypothetical protein / transcript_product=hypothetical protein / location=Cvel_scaffold3918:10182-10688(+) / protein_length=169 / sequence_SO=supercontig / SO=protein_coding / is_pseudo=false
MYGLKNAPRMFTSWLKTKLQALFFFEIAESILIRLSSRVPPSLQVEEVITESDMKVMPVESAMQMHVDDLICFARDARKTLKEVTEAVESDEVGEVTDNPVKCVEMQLLHDREGGEIRQSQRSYLNPEKIPPGKKGSKSLDKTDFTQPQPEEIDMKYEALYRALLGMLG